MNSVLEPSSQMAARLPYVSLGSSRCLRTRVWWVYIASLKNGWSVLRCNLLSLPAGGEGGEWLWTIRQPRVSTENKEIVLSSAYDSCLHSAWQSLAYRLVHVVITGWLSLVHNTNSLRYPSSMFKDFFYLTAFVSDSILHHSTVDHQGECLR